MFFESILKINQELEIYLYQECSTLTFLFLRASKRNFHFFTLFFVGKKLILGKLTVVRMNHVRLMHGMTEFNKILIEEVLKRITVVLRVDDGVCLIDRNRSTCSGVARTRAFYFHV